MTRKALLIASPNAGVQLPGARKDCENYRAFLTSLCGGAWDDQEVKTLIDPKRAEVMSALAAMHSADYGFVTFSGHGFHVASATLNDTTLELTATESCKVLDLNPRTKRQFVVIDCCRGLVSLTEERRNAINAKLALANARIFTSRAEVRAVFDETVMGAEEGRVVAFSCKINQSAGEDPSIGGVFSNSLVRRARDWSGPALTKSILSVASAFDLAKETTLAKNFPQEPELHAGRRLRHFAFAVGQ